MGFILKMHVFLVLMMHFVFHLTSIPYILEKYESQKCLTVLLKNAVKYNCQAFLL